ncbi:MAG: hypothetical protein IJN29_03540 [Akkermansia sp.]|nr:hypothetical protein [Akkermansia sp.]
MKNIISMILAVCCLLLSTQALAQVEVRIQPDRKEFLLGENVAFNVRIDNYTDRSISFVNIPGHSWLHFTLTRSGESQPITPALIPNFPKLTVPAGSTRVVKACLRPYYTLNRDGVYKVVATVRMPDMRTNYSSNRASFTLAHGGTVRTFTVESRGVRLNMSLRLLRVGGKDCLFGQVINADSQSVLGACFMGQYLNFMKPRIVLDSAQNMHVLCQSTPEYFTYSKMNNQGQRVDYKVMKRTGGPVDLVSANGGIRAVGLVPYVRPQESGSAPIFTTADRPGGNK